MKRALILALSGLVATAVTGCGKKEAPGRRPARGLRGRRRPEGRPRLPGARRPDEGLPGRRDPGPRRGLPGPRGLHRGHLRAQGHAPLPDRPVAPRGGPRQREGATSRRPQARLAEDQHRREPPDAPRRSSRRSASRSSTTRSPPRTRPAPRWTRTRRRSTRRRSTSATRTITSPLDGLVGTTQVKAGNLVGRGESTLLTTVSQVDPILFRAGISEAEYLRIAKQVAGATAASKATRQKAEIELLLADGTVHAHKGTRRRHRAGGRPDHRHPGRPVHVPEPRAARAARAVRAGPVRHRDEGGARCSSPSAP